MAPSVAIVYCGGQEAGELEKAVSRAAGRHGLAITVRKAVNPDIIRASDLVILFGGCGFEAGMKSLAGADGILEALEHVVLVERKPILGIGCGMMLFAEKSSGTKPCLGLGWILGKVSEEDPAFDAEASYPYQNSVQAVSGHSLFAGLENAEFSFMSKDCFKPENEAHILAKSKEKEKTVIAIERDNIAGVLFHPELSGEYGEQFLANFLHWTPS
jgi:glutamine amidotransferase